MYNMQQNGQQGWNQLGSDMFKIFGDYLMKGGNKKQALPSNPWGGIGMLPTGGSGMGR